jgi:hypothetical protein
MNIFMEKMWLYENKKFVLPASVKGSKGYVKYRIIT